MNVNISADVQISLSGGTILNEVLSNSACVPSDTSRIKTEMFQVKQELPNQAHLLWKHGGQTGRESELAQKVESMYKETNERLHYRANIFTA